MRQENGGGVLAWGLIGCGDIARKRVAPAFRDLATCRLAAVSRARKELAESFAREFDAGRWYGDWQELLKDPEVQAVYVATPTHLHAEQTVAAAEAGKQVICEKPMAMDAAQCRRMIDACRAAGVGLSVAYYRHFYPAIHRIAGILASGEIGRVVLAQINAFECYDFPPGDPHFWVMQRGSAGGGPMMDFGCHRLEVLLHLFGPAQLRCGGAAKVVFPEREVEDTAVAWLSFRGGGTGLLTVSTAVRQPADTLDIHGTEGSIRVPVLNQGVIHVRSSQGERREEHPPHPNLHLPYIEAVTRAFLANEPPPVPGETGLGVAVLEEAIYAGR